MHPQRSFILDRLNEELAEMQRAWTERENGWLPKYIQAKTKAVELATIFAAID